MVSSSVVESTPLGLSSGDDIENRSNSGDETKTFESVGAGGLQKKGSTTASALSCKKKAERGKRESERTSRLASIWSARSNPLDKAAPPKRIAAAPTRLINPPAVLKTIWIFRIRSIFVLIFSASGSKVGFESMVGGAVFFLEDLWWKITSSWGSTDMASVEKDGWEREGGRVVVGGKTKEPIRRLLSLHDSRKKIREEQRFGW